MSDFCFDFVLYLSAALAVCILSDCGSGPVCVCFPLTRSLSLFLYLTRWLHIYFIFIKNQPKAQPTTDAARPPPAKTSNGTHKKIYYKKILQTLLANQTHTHTYTQANTHTRRKAQEGAGRPEKASSEILLHTCGRQLQFHMCCAAPARAECAQTHTYVYVFALRFLVLVVAHKKIITIHNNLSKNITKKYFK